MKLLELAITDTRGIRNLSLSPNGGSLVIWGTNGSGKSGVVDALEFLLTGEMTRLKGEGTFGISLRQHGPHVLSEPEDAVVSGTFAVSDGSEPITLGRSIADPNELRIEPTSSDSLALVSGFQRGQHILTRRDILRFISANASTRGERMKQLLDVADVDSARKAIVSVGNLLQQSAQAARSSYEDTVTRFVLLTGNDDTSRSSVLVYVNQARKVLGAGEISDSPSITSFKQGVNPPGDFSVEKRPTRTQLDRLLDVITREVGTSRRPTLTIAFKRLRALAEAFHAQPTLLKHFQRREFVGRGLTLLGDDANCPLCDTTFGPGELREHLSAVLKEIDETERRVKELDEIQSDLLRTTRTTEAALTQIETLLNTHLQDQAARELPELTSWLSDLASVKGILESGIGSLEKERLGDLDIGRLVTDTRVGVAMAAKESLIASAVTLSPEQQAWDLLTKLDLVLEQAKLARRSRDKQRIASERAGRLLALFDKAQEEVLDSLYGSIRDRFVELYRSIHDSDEAGFEAELRPKGSSLELEVGFYDQGLHPSQALHSEGHQDSMGVCLFLALSEKLSVDDPSLILLDDVVMSLDTGHRKKFAALLATQFPEIQFLITTHDKTWAEQLVNAGVVTRSNSHRFGNWDLLGGPRTSIQEQVWDIIDKDLEADNVERAAGALRRSAEEFFQDVCDGLASHVRFSIDSRWELEDLLPPAVSSLKRLLKTAKSSANSHNNAQALQELSRFEDDLSEVVQRVGMEKWSINPNVHYNAWHTFHRNDFIPVVKAFRDLFSTFQCEACGAKLRRSTDGNKTETLLSCECGKISWNLQLRSK